jgi:hypothetical protein
MNIDFHGNANFNYNKSLSSSLVIQDFSTV